MVSIYNLAADFECLTNIMYMMNTLYILLISGFSEDHISSRICSYSKADEYQDSNYVQEQILLQLARPSNNIFA
jgi:hypothetical protein